jgi:hypothetical protein
MHLPTATTRRKALLTAIIPLNTGAQPHPMDLEGGFELRGRRRVVGRQVDHLQLEDR